MSLESVLFEACNTSFQLHLQINPDDFVDNYNWAQMISGPVMAATANSPLLFGKELWSETRIALFKQSLDTRTSKNQMRKKLPRVYFGDDWLKGDASSLWKEQIMRFPVLLTSDDFECSTEQIREGNAPKLRAAQLHNGTSYTWNRLCYGSSGMKPHIRIECRYIPSGPSPIDEMGNFVFWIGLMLSQKQDWQDKHQGLDFKAVKNNFIKAARYGLDVSLNWFGKQVPVSKLILDDLLIRAADALNDFGIDSSDVSKYLGVIEKRVSKNITGADWIRENYRLAQRKMNNMSALKYLSQAMIENQSQNLAVHEWKYFNVQHIVQEQTDFNHLYVEDYMTSDIFCLKENYNVALAKSLFKWKNFHHLPIENDRGELVGLLTDGIMSRIEGKEYAEDLLIQDIMITELISVHSQDTITAAWEKMESNNLTGIPVVYENKLVGILTNNDIPGQ